MKRASRFRTRRDNAEMDESLSTELADRAARDQAARRSWLRPGLSASDRSAAAESVEATDRDNAARLREILAEHGWPGHGLVGRAGAHAAWLLAQHAPSGPAGGVPAAAGGGGGAR